jgi:hypothetical protein
MIVYPCGVILDVDLGLGREFGYNGVEVASLRAWHRRVGQSIGNVRAVCHPSRTHAARQLCHTCYNFWYRTGYTPLMTAGEEEVEDATVSGKRHRAHAEG